MNEKKRFTNIVGSCIYTPEDNAMSHAIAPAFTVEEALTAKDRAVGAVQHHLKGIVFENSDFDGEEVVLDFSRFVVRAVHAAQKALGHAFVVWAEGKRMFIAQRCMTYSLITVHSNKDGRVSGSWLQDCCRGLDNAIERAKGTSKVNSGMPIAVVRGFVPPGEQGVFHSIEDTRAFFITG